ncbi:MAG: SpoIIE family protein phosphatase [Alphaproteobacteria bacterium]|nr:SpoIIE family protein phosphatase [Alphaproteobacteria bacterium]
MSTIPRRLLPLATTTALPGIGQCEDYEGLLAALSSGSKQILAGRSIGELAAMLPIPHKSDVLQLVAEGRLVHGEKAAADLAHALSLRVQLSTDDLPKLRLVLAELLQNAVEHGNLGFGQARQDSGRSLDDFVNYHANLTEHLAGPLGRIPVRLSCRAQQGHLIVELEDRGLGFRVREVTQRQLQTVSATGRGIGLIHDILAGNLWYDAGGRVVRFSLPLQATATPPTPTTLRAKAKVLAWAGNSTRVPQLTRLGRMAGVQRLEVTTSLRTLQEQAGNQQLILLDAHTANFANLAYTLGDLQRDHPQLPVLLITQQASAALHQLVLSFPQVDLWEGQTDHASLALRLERMVQQRANLQETHRLSELQRTEIERTRIFQQEMMPKASTLSAMAQDYGVQLAASYVGCDTLAGDYWTIAAAGPDHLAFGVMDFTGHGLRAAMNTVQLHALLKTEWHLADPVEIASHLNANLHQLLGPGCYAAYVYGVLNSRTGELRYCAGGAPAMLRKSRGGGLKELPCNGLPLGLTPKLTPTLRQGYLDEGESLLVVSDALTDAPHHNGTRWGPEGLAEAWRTIPPAMKARNALQALLDTFHKTVKRPVPDDLTALILKRP